MLILVLVDTLICQEMEVDFFPSNIFGSGVKKELIMH